jgi:hypothetical protein
MNHLKEMIRDEIVKENQIYDAPPLKRVLRSWVCYNYIGQVPLIVYMKGVCSESITKLNLKQERLGE